MSNAKTAQEEINAKIEEELAKQLRRIPELVEKAVSQAVLSILGISKRNGGFEVDTFGGKNPLNGYIQRTVETSMDTYVKPLVDKKLKGLMNRKTLPRSVATETIRQASYTFTRTVKNRVEKKMESLGKKAADRVCEHLEDSLDEIGNINLDINDPKSFEGPIGDVLLEEVAQQMAKGQ